MKTRVRNMNKDALVFHHGSSIIAYSASDNTCRGRTLTTVLIDDAAHISWNRADAVWALIIPAVQAIGGKIIVTATNESGKIAIPEGMIKHALAAEGFVKLGSNFENKKS